MIKQSELDLRSVDEFPRVEVRVPEQLPLQFLLELSDFDSVNGGVLPEELRVLLLGERQQLALHRALVPALQLALVRVALARVDPASVAAQGPARLEGLAAPSAFVLFVLGNGLFLLVTPLELVRSLATALAGGRFVAKTEGLASG